MRCGATAPCAPVGLESFGIDVDPQPAIQAVGEVELRCARGRFKDAQFRHARVAQHLEIGRLDLGGRAGDLEGVVREGTFA